MFRGPRQSHAFWVDEVWVWYPKMSKCAISWQMVLIMGPADFFIAEYPATQGAFEMHLIWPVDLNKMIYHSHF